MIKFSVKYYLKSLAISLIFYICGGFVLSFFLTEEEGVLSILVPILIMIAGVFIRIVVLKHQMNKYSISDFDMIDYFKISLPAICLLALTIIILICEVCMKNIGNFMYQSVFDNVKSVIFVLFPGGLTVDGIIYNLSHWNNSVYYSLLIINIVIYIFPTFIYMRIRENIGNDFTSD